MLAFPQFYRGFILDTDASSVGIGAVLTQNQDNGTVTLVAYASRILQFLEKNYGVTEMEALGIV